ncbi:MAG TPA: GNAT family N-acetyltransferase, partial [Candidatus Acidoferrales bacterium]|nr:GNAT family N-acetyltransferase [Candidatus Acidoferrales bacterium]
RPEELPKPAIRPYPTQYVREWRTKSGSAVLIRPIRPEDELMMVKFHGTLSSATVYLRYFHMVSLDTRVAHERLMQQCFIDYDREMALVAEIKEPKSGGRAIVAVARLTKERAEAEAEIAVVVSDAYQGIGLGTEMVRRLIDVGRDEKLERIVAKMLPENNAMLALARHFGFLPRADADLDGLTVVLDLRSAGSAREQVTNAT